MNFKVSIFFLFAVIMISSCSSPRPLKIALSKASGSANYDKYIAWLKAADATNKYIDLIGYSAEEACNVLDSCDGLVLTGGPDLATKYFGNPADTSLCEIDPHRDSLDMALISRAYIKKIPVLGICRGVQLVNVSFGGKLIVDIPRDKPSEVKHKIEGGASEHNITISDYSYLKKFTAEKNISVNSFHHQAVGKVADYFIVGALADDGIAESLEWREPKNKPYFLGGQWHPERLNFNHPLSLPIAIDFLNAARNRSK